jgi:tol-pal system protein YbgF
VLYNKAYAYLTATQYREAEAWLLEFTKRYPADVLADNAYYWLGESRLVQNNPAGAVQAFRDGLRALPKGAKAPDNLFKMGVALEQLKQPQLAKAAWEKLLKDFPTNPLAERAKARLAGLKV